MKKISILGTLFFLIGTLGVYFLQIISFNSTPKQPKIVESILPNGNTSPYPTKTPMGFSLSCAREAYEPVCGAVEIQCITTPCDPIEETFPNECAAKERGAEVVYEGLCKKDKPQEVNTIPDPVRNYKSKELNVCSRIRFLCEAGFVPFSDDTGCGCETETSLTTRFIEPEIEAETIEDDGRIYYNGCPHVLFQLECPEEHEIFSDNTGCGCEKIETEEITEPIIDTYEET